jgi:hypothetical protein
MTQTIKGPLTIIGMVVENFKKVVLVELKPDGTFNEIVGENRQGKSSLLDAIWAAVGGLKAIPLDPIREGQREALIKLDMGEIIVTRKFRRQDDGDFTTGVIIEAQDGSRFDKPQTMLDSLIGAISFEPMEFMELGDKEKFEAIKVFVPDVDFDAIEGQDKSDFERRTDENRKAKELKAQAAGIMLPAGEHQPVDVSALLTQLEEAELLNKETALRRQRRESVEKDAHFADLEAERQTKRIEEMKRDIERAEMIRTNAEALAREIREKLAKAPLLPDEIDTAAIREKIGAAETANRNAQDAKRRDELMTKAEAHEKASQALTEAMDARKEAVRAKIAAAEMPVPGLTLEPDGRVLLNGHPFANASTAEQLQTSLAVAMALNPTLRVIRISRGGNDLDKKAMKVIADMAAKRGYQIFVERVIAAGKPTVVMEDGHAKV